ncbi:hypothetical protein [Micromonospora antibiotica]|uniref:Uncharacterized protein n=1 Tax=Micromonospora antibiotica TaxID=2807623 RepID=A0ABS3V8X6_9ACTN|nr:hypothetical protein [Micromonospora antibiotica]MBO4162060.1 hypothetical protein [Micromonospora antibiotica]
MVDPTALLVDLTDGSDQLVAAPDPSDVLPDRSGRTVLAAAWLDVAQVRAGPPGADRAPRAGAVGTVLR